MLYTWGTSCRPSWGSGRAGEMLDHPSCDFQEKVLGSKIANWAGGDGNGRHLGRGAQP